MVILGIDPGLSCTGLGAIRFNRDFPVLYKEELIRTSSKDPLPKRLHRLYREISRHLDEIKPDLIAIEDIFSSIRYPKSGLILGEVLGIILLAGEERNIAIMDIPAREARDSLIGYGNANKRQVREVVKRLLKRKEIKSFHIADALAIALVAHFRTSSRLKT